MIMSDVIDERIRPLVATMNACGFVTFASCEGHGFPVDGLLPYVAFYCDIEAAARLEALLRGDAESQNPQLNWGWRAQRASGSVVSTQQEDVPQTSVQKVVA